MNSDHRMTIQRGSLIGFFARLFGFRFHGCQLSKEGVRLLGGGDTEVSFADFAGPVTVGRRLGFPNLQVRVHGRSPISVVGLPRSAAMEFAAQAEHLWMDYFEQEFDRVRADFERLSTVLERLGRPRHYPSACLLEPFVQMARSSLQALPLSMPERLTDTAVDELIRSARSLANDAHRFRNSGIKAFIESELRENDEFFSSSFPDPLTPEQRLAVVTDEDATLVLASAGSGKTTVIAAKAAYLLNRGIRSPSEILMLAFGKDAALEMSQRVAQITGETVDALTFHALGYAIIREVEGTAPALAASASDEGQLRIQIREILQDLADDPSVASTMLRMSSSFFWPYRSEWDFQNHDEYFRYVETHELRSLHGDRVKSFEELEIANWLFLNGVEFEYEPVYEFDLPENDRRQYTPDFRLTDSGVYIEHFGVRRSQAPDGSVQLMTAPYVDRVRYLDDMEWKRKVHREHGTILVETYSYERMEGNLTDSLSTKLAPYVTVNPISEKAALDRLSEMGQVDALSQTIATFLRQFKGAGMSVEQCRVRGVSSEDPQRSAAFLVLFERVLSEYQRRLNGRIDFEDMISRAADYVEQHRYKSRYLHLIVDEYQDISAGRARLLRALKNQHEEARVFAVGDDWQSIYRFAGSDLSQMRNFGEAFGGTLGDQQGVHSVEDLGRTFRSVDKIANAARRFILKNPMQLQKRVKAAHIADSPAIKVRFFPAAEETQAITATLKAIAAESTSSTSVLLLGRYRHVEPRKVLSEWKRHPTLSVRFMTIHSSKGLEADHIIVLRATAEEKGFPSEIVDDPLLDLVMTDPENFEHSEERRVFYVAITRARKSVTILADRDRPSIFALELTEDPEYGAITAGEPRSIDRRCGECGGRLIAHTAHSGRLFYICEHRRLCGNTLPACERCGRDMPSAESADPGNLRCSCGATYARCPKCRDGWLVERTGKYGKFLGCVRYPDCTGKRRIAASKKRPSSSSRRR